jgi:dimethylargininase
LAEALAPFGYAVIPVAVPGCLHLKSAITAVDEDTLLVNPAWVDLAPFGAYRRLEVDPGEPEAANVLSVAGHVIAHRGFPRTLERLAYRGYSIQPVDVSEFLKAEAGVTCKSIVYRAG